MSNTFGLFNASVMGMSAQAEALANVSENIANANTIGYKRTTTNFLTVLNGFQGQSAFGGGVFAVNRPNVAAQGALAHTDSPTDLAIRGNGFFVVSDGSGGVFLTRAGSFAPDSQGRLVNSAGYYLMAAPAGANSNSLSNMEIVQIHNDRLYADPTTSGTLSANLPATAQIVPAANLPSANSAASTYSAKTSVTVYDNLGEPVVLDVYYAKTANNSWEMTLYNSADRTNGGFPYTTGALATQTITFSATDGSTVTGGALHFTPPGGSEITLDMSKGTQLGAAFSVNSLKTNGNAASPVSGIQISSDGTLNYQLDSGQLVPAYQIAIGNVAAPSALQNFTGNVYAASKDSGDITIGSAGVGGLGTISSSTLEGSTVDLATELSTMIIAQRSYTANTQSFQVASEILQVLNNLK